VHLAQDLTGIRIGAQLTVGRLEWRKDDSDELGEWLEALQHCGVHQATQRITQSIEVCDDDAVSTSARWNVSPSSS
jgi:hypothetical protein